MKNKKMWFGIFIGTMTVIIIALFLYDIIRRKQAADSKPDYVAVEETDPGMKAAEAKARGTIGRFIEDLTHPKSSYSYFAIKGRFEQDRNVEYLWVNFLTYDGKKFSGSVANTPRFITSVQYGREVRIAPDSIADWMVIDNGVLVGGYTLREFRKKMNPPERREFDAKGGFTVPEDSTGN